MKIFYSDTFNLPLPEGHRFPGQKYRMLREQLLSDGILSEDELHLSPLAETPDLVRGHTPAYVDAVLTGGLDDKEIRRIGLPWSPQLAERSRATVGGQLAAVETALDVQESGGISGQLAGGTHHAHPDFGSGYCVFNDQACAALKALHHGWVKRIAVIDLDIHQGDGTAAILADHPAILVLSIHGAKNFPFRKVPSTIDIALPDDIDDDGYLERLAEVLPRVWNFQPELVLYQSGVDPLESDTLGRARLTFDGLMARDRAVLKQARDQRIPVSMAIGGGYANPISDSVRAYANTYLVARELYG